MIYIAHQLSEPASRWYCYRIAEQCIAFSEPVRSLSEFKFDSSPMDVGNEQVEQLSRRHELLTDQNSQAYYQDTLVFNNRMCSIVYRRSESEGIAQIDIDGEPSCAINLTHFCITVLNGKPFDDLFNLELITGPALILLLSTQSIYCLHAGAVTVSDGSSKPINVAFIAESGVGKSTLSQDAGKAWVQCADDILPIVYKQNPKLFSDFPQLKLPNFRAGNKLLKNNDLRFIFNIKQQGGSRIVIEKMKPVDAVLVVVRHTVASRLFEPEIMRQHLEFTQRLANEVGVYQISYPRDLSQLPLLRKKITEFVVNADQS